jgi:hypothetical protein
MHFADPLNHPATLYSPARQRCFFLKKLYVEALLNSPFF